VSESKVKHPIWWISVNGFNPSTTIQVGEERRQPSIDGNFKVKFYEGVHTGYDDFEGTWQKLIWADDHGCSLILEAQSGSGVAHLKDEWIREAIREVVEAHFQDMKLVVDAVVDRVSPSPRISRR